ncbi:MAG: dihydrodipicolinate synthase family protein [Victivallaceae bacterium]|nr:dihydrodipicolinate synthase family protein [Victivallaceae bacterium]
MKNRKSSMTPRQLKNAIKGVVHLVMTPFDEQENLNEEALRGTVRDAVATLKGEDAVLLTVGSTGEFYAMNDEENKRVAEIVVDAANGEIPVLVGTARGGTRYTIEMSQYAQSVGADGVMIVPPYYHLVSQEGLYRHYKAVAESIDIGIMVYNNAITSKIYVDPTMLQRLSKIDNIIACKENVWNIMGFHAAVRAVDPEDMIFICGVGHMMYKFEANFGAVGYVTELANFVPHVALGLYKACRKNDYDEIEKWSKIIAPYAAFVGKMAAKRGPLPTVISPAITVTDQAMYQGVCKAAMELVGKPMGKVREPMENLTVDEKKELREILRGMGAAVVD